MSGTDDVAALAADKHAMDKYSRQIGEFGLAAMAKLVHMKVLVIGLTGVGIEVSKNLILQGVGEVALFDDETVKIEDLGTNFYLKEEDVGNKTRSEACYAELDSLNPLVRVSIHSGKLTNKDVKKYTMVVDCGLSLEAALTCDKICREVGKDIKFIRARVHGLVGYYFSDFGEEFSVLDKTGEQPVTRVIDKITSDPENPDELIVTIIAEKHHNIEINGHTNFVKFEEVSGELGDKLNNAKEPFEVKENTRKTEDGRDVFDPYSFRVLNAKVGDNIDYHEGGTIIQAFRPVKLKFKSLEESLKSPIHPELGMLPMPDGAKWGRSDQLHIALNGLWRFEKEFGKLPKANDKANAAKVVEFAKEYNDEMKASEDGFSVDELDVDVVEKLALYAETQLQPMCCFFGGIVAQEVVKYTGKYSPMMQWFYLDAFEVLPEEQVAEDNPEKFIPTAEDREPVGSRYDDLIKIFGKPLHRKLMESSTFMVGCGALGCELLKNFALLGLACSEDTKKGKITVTDNDTIEISNLSRQFLFREHNVQQPKSVAAGEAVQKMNKNINIESLQSLVSPASEDIFDSKFWAQQDFITNALDNVKARLYVDSQCVFYGKPLLESGTLGTKCNSQVILPHMTASYADGPMDEPETIPMCTLRNFPSQIEHCIEWSRAKFTDLFETDSTKASNFISKPSDFIAEMKSKMTDLSAAANELDSLRRVVHILNASMNKETSFETCVKEAFEEFHPLFRDNINVLIKSKPENAVDDNGQPFWGKVKRFPQAAIFDTSNHQHLNFVLAFANILSLTYGVVQSEKEFRTDVKEVAKICSQLKAPEAKDLKVDLSTEEDDKKEELGAGDAEMEEFKSLVGELDDIANAEELKSIKIEPASFEKDDDANFHIDFITAASNIRGWNYRMKEVSRHKCKMISGKIIPAIATTTAAVTGLICMELLKVIQPGKKLEAFKDSSNSLGVNMFQLMEPPPPAKAKDEEDLVLLTSVVCLPTGFTKWDKTLVEGKDFTVQQFIDAFKKLMKSEHDKDLQVTYLAHPNSVREGAQGVGKYMYNEDDPDEVKKGILGANLLEKVTEIYGASAIGHTRVRLDISVVDDEGQAYKVPELLYVFA